MDVAYENKLKSVQRFIPFLENMIEQLKDPRMKNRQQQLTKMELLYNMITDKKKKLKVDTLNKCEDVIVKLYHKVNGGKARPPPLPVTPNAQKVDRRRTTDVIVIDDSPPKRKEELIKIPIGIGATTSKKVLSFKPLNSYNDLEIFERDDPNELESKMSLQELNSLRNQLCRKLKETKDDSPLSDSIMEAKNPEKITEGTVIPKCDSQQFAATVGDEVSRIVKATDEIFEKAFHGLDKMKPPKTIEETKTTNIANKSTVSETSSLPNSVLADTNLKKISPKADEKHSKEKKHKDHKKEHKHKHKEKKEDSKKTNKEETKKANNEETKNANNEEIKKANKEDTKKTNKDDTKKLNKEEVKKPVREEGKKPTKEEVEKTIKEQTETIPFIALHTPKENSNEKSTTIPNEKKKTGVLTLEEFSDRLEKQQQIVNENKTIDLETDVAKSIEKSMKESPVIKPRLQASDFFSPQSPEEIDKTPLPPVLNSLLTNPKATGVINEVVSALRRQNEDENAKKEALLNPMPKNNISIYSPPNPVPNRNFHPLPQIDRQIDRNVMEINTPYNNYQQSTFEPTPQHVPNHSHFHVDIGMNFIPSPNNIAVPVQHPYSTPRYEDNTRDPRQLNNVTRSCHARPSNFGGEYPQMIPYTPPITNYNHQSVYNHIAPFGAPRQNFVGTRDPRINAARSNQFPMKESATTYKEYREQKEREQREREQREREQRDIEHHEMEKRDWEQRERQQKEQKEREQKEREARELEKKKEMEKRERERKEEERRHNDARDDRNGRRFDDGRSRSRNFPYSKSRNCSRSRSRPPDSRFDKAYSVTDDRKKLSLNNMYGSSSERGGNKWYSSQFKIPKKHKEPEEQAPPNKGESEDRNKTANKKEEIRQEKKEKQPEPVAEVETDQTEKKDDAKLEVESTTDVAVTEDHDAEKPPELENKNEEAKPVEEKVKEDKVVDEAGTSNKEENILSKFFQNLMKSGNKDEKKGALLSLITTFADSFSDKQLNDIKNIIKTDHEGDGEKTQVEPELTAPNVAEAKEPTETPKTDVDVGKKESIENQEAPTENVGKNVPKPRSKLKTELDRLHEDIREMFIRDGVVTASGRRMCRALSVSKSEETSGQSVELEQKEEKKPPSVKTKTRRGGFRKAKAVAKVEMKELSVLVPKIKMNEVKKPCGRYSLRRVTKPTNYKEIDDLKDVEKIVVSKEAESPEKLDKSNDSSKNVIVEEKEKEVVVEEPDDTPSLKSSPAAPPVVSKKVKPKKKRPKKSVKKNKLKKANAADKSASLHDKTYFSSSKSIACKLCPFSSPWMAAHYTSAHPDVDVLSSRMSPEATEFAIADALLNRETYENDEAINLSKQKFTCLFCDHSVVTKSIFFRDHLSVHTGEFRRKCPYCRFSRSNVRRVRHHIRTSHADKPLKPAVSVPALSYNNLYGYLCECCHYVQLSRERVEQHVKSCHPLEKNCQIYKIKFNNQNINKEETSPVLSAPVKSEMSDAELPEMELVEKEPPTENAAMDTTPPSLTEEMELVSDAEDPLAAVVDVEIKRPRTPALRSSKRIRRSQPIEADVKPPIDEAVFTSNTDLQKQNEEIEEERLRTMQDVSNSIKQRSGLDFVEKLSHRLMTEPIAEVTVKEEPADEVDFEVPEELPVFEKSVLQRKKENEPAKQATKEPEKVNPISGVIEKLQGVLGGKNEGTSVEANSELLNAGAIKILKFEDTFIYTCCLHCIFSTRDEWSFVEHCQFAHEWNFGLEKFGRCWECGTEIECDTNNPLPMAVFSHIGKAHREFLSGVTPQSDKEVLPFATKEVLNVENPFNIVISDVMSLADEDASSPIAPPPSAPIESDCGISMGSVMKSEFALKRFLGAPDSLYKCTSYACTFSTSQKKIFAIHVQESHLFFDGRLQQCLYCGTQVAPSKLADHYDIVHGSCRFACAFCFYRSVTMDYMEIHQLLIHGVEKFKMHVVQKCDNHDDKKVLAMVGGAVKDKEQWLPYKCACSVNFYYYLKFFSHIQTCYFAKKNFECHHHTKDSTICRTPHNSYAELAKHWVDVHHVFPMWCTYCGFGGFDLNEIMIHSVFSHPMLPPHIVDRVVEIRSKNKSSLLLPKAQCNFRALIEMLCVEREKIEEYVKKLKLTVQPIGYDLQLATDTQFAKNPKHVTKNVVAYLTPTTTKTDGSTIYRLPTTTIATDDNNQQMVKAIFLTDSAKTATPIPCVRVLTQTSKPPAHVLLQATPPKLIPLDASRQIVLNELKSPPKPIEEALRNEEDSDDVAMVNTTPVTKKVAEKENDKKNSKADLKKSSADRHEEGDSKELDSEPDKDDSKGLTGYSLYRCSKCCLMFTDRFKFKTHITTSQICRHHNSSNKPYKCSHCDKFFKNPIGLLDHIESHGRCRYICSICTKRFPVSNQTKLHMRVHHNVVNVFIQPVVKENNDSVYDEFVIAPQTAVVKAAPKETPVSDGESTKNEVKTVFYSHEINELPLKAVLNYDIMCGHCKNFKNKVTSNIQRHLMLHQNDKDLKVPDTAPVNPVPCLEKNEKMFDKMYNLASSSHVGGRMGNQQKYDTKKKDKKIELNYPAFVPLTKRFQCCAIGCNYLCLEEGNLRHHLTALHNDDPKFVCVHCKTDISPDIDTIIKHLKLHDMHLYKCGACDFMYNLRHKLERHIKEKHQGQGEVEVIRSLDSEPYEETQQPAPLPVVAPSKTQKPWRCCMCKYRSATRDEVESHAKNKHDVDCRFKCSICDFKSDEMGEFDCHFDKSHPGIQLNYIAVYDKDDVGNESTTESDQFDTTPLWRRDKPRVRHIRGILFEENPVKKNKPATVVSSASTGTGSPTKKRKRSSSTVSASKGDEDPLTIKTEEAVVDVVTNDDSDGVIVIIDDDEQQPPLDQQATARETDDMNVILAYGDVGMPLTNRYMCPKCDHFSTIELREFVQHLAAELKYCKYVCGRCKKKFVTIDMIKKHITIDPKCFIKKLDPSPSDHNMRKWLKIAAVSQSAIVESLGFAIETIPENIDDFLVQSSVDHTAAASPIVCGECDFIVRGPEEMERHMRYNHPHLDVQPSTSKTTLLPGKRPSSSNANSAAKKPKPSLETEDNEGNDSPLYDVQTVLCEVDSQPFGCYYCDVIGMKSELEDHFIREHDSWKPKMYRFKCTICSAKLLTIKSFRCHFKCHDSELRQYVDIYGKIRTLTRRVALQKKYTCPICSFECVAVNSLKMRLHMRTHGKPFQCNYCQEQFSHRVEAKSHHTKRHPGQVEQINTLQEVIDKLNLMVLQVVIEDATPTETTRETKTKKNVARKSTGTIAKPREYSFYGKKPDPVDLKKLVMTFKVEDAMTLMTCHQFSKIYDINPKVLVRDCFRPKIRVRTEKELLCPERLSPSLKE